MTPLTISMVRVHGCPKWRPCSRVVSTAREHAIPCTKHYLQCRLATAGAMNKLCVWMDVIHWISSNTAAIEWFHSPSSRLIACVSCQDNIVSPLRVGINSKILRAWKWIRNNRQSKRQSFFIRDQFVFCNYFAGGSGWEVSWWVCLSCVSVCLSVCPRGYLRTTRGIFTNFLCMLLVSAARSYSLVCCR